MQIAAYPPSEQWLTIPEFPPPGWERERARRQSLRLGLHTPDRRAELERLLREVQRMDRPSALARLLYLGDDAQSLFAVDIVMKVWAARPAEVVPRIDEIAALARGVAPAGRAPASSRGFV